ncbi:hypothetical protein ABZS66_11485 [Dactylosporangium sp. NPDC005572]|uniref:hypothetical protein n=1 Tax=Dactylosporangium sp. NPDC005572 TaxID=3156889 RepID=UPI00339ED75C
MTEPLPGAGGGRYLAADTDRLRSEAFHDYYTYMQGVVDRLDSDLGGNLPVVLSVRCEVDEQLVESVDHGLPPLRATLTDLRDLSVADGSRVDELGRRLAAYEADNVETASSWVDGGNVHI